jgi:uncharacterized protein (TIGR03000 family)
MNRFSLLGFLACVLGLVAVADASARPFFGPVYRPAYRPAYRPYYPPNRMPGWDWRYIYPYSAYNLERRYYPYPVPYPYPVYAQGPTTVVSGYDSNPNYVPQPQDVLIPQATGPLKTPPPNSALIVVRVPQEFTEILFDGVRATSVGLTRYYSTPELPAAQPSRYTITAIVNRNGQPGRDERLISVLPGQTTTVDFTWPATN